MRRGRRGRGRCRPPARQGRRGAPTPFPTAHWPTCSPPSASPHPGSRWA
jgi:hypothetical protein